VILVAKYLGVNKASSVPKNRQAVTALYGWTLIAKPLKQITYCG